MITVRLAGVKDVEAIESLFRRYLLFGESSIAYVESLLGRDTVYVAEDSGKVIGVIAINSDGRIYHLAVDEGFRRQGVGRLLLNYVLENHKDLPFFDAVGWRTPNGWLAESLFLRQGFVIKQEVPLWKEDCDSVSFCPYFTGKCVCTAVVVEKPNTSRSSSD